LYYNFIRGYCQTFCRYSDVETLNHVTYITEARHNNMAYKNSLDRVPRKPASTKHYLWYLCWLAEHDI